MSSVVPSPLAPLDLTLTKDDAGTVSYWGLDFWKMAPEASRSEAGLLGAVSGP